MRSSGRTAAEAFSPEGGFTPLVNEPQDGADTIAWLRRQSWCDGTVGSFGGSYNGFTQWASASQAPEGLKAIVPTATTTDYYVAPWYSDGGALSYHTVWWWAHVMAVAQAQRTVAAGGGDEETLIRLIEALGGDEQIQLDVMPDQQELLTSYWPWWSDWMRHQARDSYWQQVCVADRAEAITTPALNVGGWFDFFVNNTARTFTQMKAEAATAEAREGQRLIIGPWDHLYQGGAYHDRQFGLSGAAAASDLTGAHLRFFDRWLRGKADALDGTAPVRIFVMGIDQWRDEQDWPLPDTNYLDCYLDSAGRANTAAGDGLLSSTPPVSEAADSYTYDPAEPVPTIGGRTDRLAALNAAGPADQRPVEDRPDVLCFTTPVLDQPVEVTGHLSLILHVASSTVDTDFTGKLVDVYPDGRALYLTDGMLRGRYRNSLAEPELLEPEQPSEITIDMSVTSNVFLAGHRIRLEVSSSNFPRYDRNLNTGAPTLGRSLDDAVIATNRILHGPQHPSRLTLPIIRR